MNIKKLMTDGRAVSPVIGVILMVAITVILAAVIGTFVLGLGDQVSTTAPQAQFSFDYNGTGVTVTHDGGDSIPSEQVTVNTSSNGSTFSDTTISSGSSTSITATSDDTVRVIWSSPSDDSTATIGKFEVP